MKNKLQPYSAGHNINKINYLYNFKITNTNLRTE